MIREMNDQENCMREFLSVIVTVVMVSTSVQATVSKQAIKSEKVEIEVNSELVTLLKKTQALNTTDADALISKGINDDTRREVGLNEELELNSVRQ